jgi:hypothetical protein
MKVLSAIRKEDKNWVFDYWSDSNPNGEMHEAGAILIEVETGDVRPGSGLQNAWYCGTAYTEANTEAASIAVQERLGKLSWTLTTSGVAVL